MSNVTGLPSREDLEYKIQELENEIDEMEKDKARRIEDFMKLYEENAKLRSDAKVQAELNIGPTILETELREMVVEIDKGMRLCQELLELLKKEKK